MYYRLIKRKRRGAKASTAEIQKSLRELGVNSVTRETRGSWDDMKNRKVWGKVLVVHYRQPTNKKFRSDTYGNDFFAIFRFRIREKFSIDVTRQEMDLAVEGMVGS